MIALKKKHGWLTNPERKNRRDRSQTLVDSQVFELLQDIQSMSNYTKLDKEANSLIKLRDQALIGTAWTWFKRGGEILGLQYGDIGFEDSEITVSLLIEKKQKTLKFCPYCKTKDKPTKNAIKANFCKQCGRDITNVPLVKVGEKHKRVTKRKNMNYPFCKPLITWHKALEQFNLKPEAWIFPRYHYFSRSFLFYAEKPLTIQRFDQILQRLDSTLTSSMFRYGGTEKYLRLKYTPFELKEIGDWSSSKMPEIYAERKGLTPSQKKFAEDMRMT